MRASAFSTILDSEKKPRAPQKRRRKKNDKTSGVQSEMPTFVLWIFSVEQLVLCCHPNAVFFLRGRQSNNVRMKKRHTVQRFGIVWTANVSKLIIFPVIKWYGQKEAVKFLCCSWTLWNVHSFSINPFESALFSHELHACSNSEEKMCVRMQYTIDLFIFESLWKTKCEWFYRLIDQQPIDNYKSFNSAESFQIHRSLSRFCHFSHSVTLRCCCWSSI